MLTTQSSYFKPRANICAVKGAHKIQHPQDKKKTAYGKLGERAEQTLFREDTQFAKRHVTKYLITLRTSLMQRTQPHTCTHSISHKSQKQPEQITKGEQVSKNKPEY